MPVPKSIHVWRSFLLSENGPSAPLARLIAVTISQDMDGRTLESFAGAARIAARSGLSERAVRKHLGELVRAGWLTERTKQHGRNYWLKVRKAAIPDGAFGALLPAQRAGSRDPAPRAGSDAENEGLPARRAGLPAPCAGLPARDDTTPCTGAHGDPAPRAAYLVQRSSTYLEQDPERARPATLKGSRARKKTPEPSGQISETPEVLEKRRQAAEIAQRGTAALA